MKEVDVILVTNVNYTIALASDWFEVLVWREMPEWGYRCLLHAPYVGAEEMGRAIVQVSQYEPDKKDVYDCVAAVLGHLRRRIGIIQ